MSIVNPQITDAVASPGLPPAGFDGAIEQALAKAANDAVAAQEQFYVFALAAATSGVAAMLSTDTAATALQVKKDVDKAADAVRPEALMAVREEASSHGGDVVRVSGVSHEMNDLGQAYCRNLMRVVQIAATSACATAMIARPEQFDHYGPILEAIKNLV